MSEVSIRHPGHQEIEVKKSGYIKKAILHAPTDYLQSMSTPTMEYLDNIENKPQDQDLQCEARKMAKTSVPTTH